MKSTIHKHHLKTNILMVSKKLVSILGILFVLMLSGCSSESNPSHASIVDGTWKLVHVGGTISGVNNNFEPGVIKWTFNPITQTVTVVNNNTDNNLIDVFETGVYNYQIVASENPGICSQSLKIDGADMGCFSIVDGKLQIDQSFADGLTVTLAP